MKYKHEQRLLTEVPVGGRFMERAGCMENRRYYVVAKHYNGHKRKAVEIEYPIADAEGKLTGEIGREMVMRKDPDVVIPRTKVKYIQGYEDVKHEGGSSQEPIWVNSVWDNEGVYVIYLNEMDELSRQ